MYIFSSFGLLRAFPPLQRPIHRSFLLLLDFHLLFISINKQSTTLFSSFCKSSVHFSASTSNPPLFSVPFGLPPCISLLQRPIHHSISSLLDFLRVFHYFNIQSTSLFLPFWTSARLSSASTSNPPRNFFPFGLPPCIPLLQRPIPICTLTFSSIANILIANLPTMCV